MNRPGTRVFLDRVIPIDETGDSVRTACLPTPASLKVPDSFDNSLLVSISLDAFSEERQQPLKSLLVAARALHELSDLISVSAQKLLNRGIELRSEAPLGHLQRHMSSAVRQGTKRPSKRLSRHPQVAGSVSQLIRARGLQQKEIAQRLKLQPSNLNLFLRGHKDVRSELLLRLLAHLGVDVHAEIERATHQATQVQSSVAISPIDAIESVYHLLRPVDRMALLEYIVGMARLQLGEGASAPLTRLKAELKATRGQV